MFPDKNETINFFLKNTNEPAKTIKEIFESDDNILNDNIKCFIQNYTKESFYYKYYHPIFQNLYLNCMITEKKIFINIFIQIHIEESCISIEMK